MNASGRIGDIVISQRNGKTILSKRPSPSSKPATQAQKAHRVKFAAMVQAKKAAKALGKPLLNEKSS